jgi:hypothetical protein
MRSITLFFSVAPLALAAWVWSSPGFALTVPVGAKTGMAPTEGFTGVSEKSIQIAWRRPTGLSLEQRKKAAKEWAKAKRPSGGRTSVANRRRLEQLQANALLRLCCR